MSNQKGNLYLIIAVIVGVFAISAVGFASWKYFDGQKDEFLREEILEVDDLIKRTVDSEEKRKINQETNTANNVIDVLKLPEIKRFDEKIKDNIYQGVAYVIDKPSKDNNSDITFNLSKTPDWNVYSVTAKLAKISIMENNNLKPAVLSDLENGSIFKIIGGKEGESCCASPTPILNSKQIILLKKPTNFVTKIYTGIVEGGASDQFFGFQPDENQGLKLQEYSNEVHLSTKIMATWPKKNNYFIKLNNMDKPLKLDPNNIGQNLPYAGETIVEANQVCPQDNYPCYLNAEKAIILNLRDLNPNQEFNCEGKMTFKFDDKGEHYIFVNATNSKNSANFSSKTFFIFPTAQIFLVHSENNQKELINLETYSKIKTPEFLNKDSDLLWVEITGKFICPELEKIANGSKTFIDCKRIVDSLIITQRN